MSAGWILASQSAARYVAVHPSGNNHDEWIRSGKEAANDLFNNIWFQQLAPKSVLEFGCGPGRILRHLGLDSHDRHIERVVGVDVAVNYISEVKALGLEGHLSNEFNDLVDLIFSLTVFIHLDKVEGRKALEWCYAHLSPGGIALLQIPIYLDCRDPETWTHIGTWTEDLLVKTANEVGFQVLELFVNERKFSYDNCGPYHSHYQVLRKPILNKLK
jgi:SAM-dependent methyltransferase